MANIAEIMELYTAYFNRAADKDGVDYWANEVDTNGWTLDQVAQSFADQTEYTTLYSGMTNAEIVTAVYTNVLNRDADADGAAYWVAELDAETMNVQNLVQAVVAAAKEDVDGLGDADVIANKTAVSQYAYDNNRNDTDTSVAAITSDATTVTTATDAIDVVIADEVAAAEAAAAEAAAAAAEAEAIANTLTLTTSIDTIAGTSADNTIVGDNSTTSTADQVAGGAGTDTVKIYGSTTLPVMTSIENLYVNTPGGNLDVSGLSITSLEADTAAARTFTLAEAQDITLDSTTGLTVVTGAATVTQHTITVDGLGSTAGTVGLDVQGGGVTTLDIATANNASYILLDDIAGATITTLNITGDQTLSIDIDADNSAGTNPADAITTIDASTTTGDVTLTGIGAAANTVTTGSGNDTLAFDAPLTATALDVESISTGAGNDTVNVDDVTNSTGFDFTDTTVTIDGGADYDTLIVAEGEITNLAATAATAKSTVTNFEEVKVVGADGTGDDFDMDLLTAASGITDVWLDTASGNTVSNMVSGSTLTITGQQASANTTVTVKDAAAAGHATDVLNIQLEDTTDAQTFEIVVADVETININSDEDATPTTGELNEIILDATETVTLNITGNEDLDMNPSANTDLTSVQTIDASGLDGKLTIDFSSAAQGVLFTGTDKADTITTSGNVDQLTLGAGADTLLTLSSNTVITDFACGTGGDIIDISGTTTTANTTSAGLAADTDGTLKVVVENTNAAVTAADNTTLAISVATATDYDTLAELATLFGATAEFSAVTSADEVILLVAAADTGDTYVYSLVEAGGGATTDFATVGTDTATLEATLTGVTAADLDTIVAAQFI